MTQAQAILQALQAGERLTARGSNNQKYFAGSVVGIFTLVRRDKKSPHHAWMKCPHCNKEKRMQIHSAMHSKSCGCRTAEILRIAQSTHGASKPYSPLYSTFKTWTSMRKRCQWPDHKSYAYYGGRGITVCGRWEKFENFLADMGPRPDGHCLGRKNNDGNYHKRNCQWETPKQQANNRRSSLIISAFGKRQTLQQWCDELGCVANTVAKRIENGWTHIDAITKPMKIQKNSHPQNVQFSLARL